MNLDQRAIVKFKNQAEAMTRKAKTALAKADKAVATVITSSEVGASAFLFGLIQGKFGGCSIVGVPADLLSGLALHVLAFAGIGGANAHHLHAFGDGALASYLNSLGKQVGISLQSPEDKKAIAQAKVSGEISGLSGGATLADEELARMVREGR